MMTRTPISTRCMVENFIDVDIKNVSIFLGDLNDAGVFARKRFVCKYMIMKTQCFLLHMFCGIGNIGWLCSLNVASSCACKEMF